MWVFAHVYMWNGTQPFNHKMFPKQTSKTWLLARYADRIAWNQSFTECQNNRLPLVKSTQGYFLTSWEEAIASDRKQRLAKQNVGSGFFIWRKKEDWCYVRCTEQHSINTIKLAHVANITHEPPELEYTYSAKSRLAKQYRNKAREVQANKDKVTQAGHSSSRHLSEGKVRSGDDLCSFKPRPTFLWQSIFF